MQLKLLHRDRFPLETRLDFGKFYETSKYQNCKLHGRDAAVSAVNLESFFIYISKLTIKFAKIQADSIEMNRTLENIWI